MTETELQSNFLAHIKKEEKIWKDCEDKLYQKYLKQGYYQWWAESKAKREVRELRSRPRNPANMHIPAEQTTQGDLD